MPPRKKNRQSARLESTPSGDAVEDPPHQPHSFIFDDELAATTTDAWTDEQEIALFKGIIKWKPVGMHKHFRMIAISQYLQSHSHDLPENSHTSTARIWDKLRTLYNIEALDERENTHNDLIIGNDDPEKTDSFTEFELQGDELADMMFAKRLASEASPSSPASVRNQGIDDLSSMHRQSTVEDTDDPRPSPTSVRETRSGRGPKTTRSTRKSQLKEMTNVQSERRSSKASVDETNEDDQEDDEEAEDGEAAGKQDDDSPADSPVASKNKSTRTKRRRGGRRK